MVAKKQFFSATIESTRLRPAELFWIVKNLVHISGPEEGKSSMKRCEQVAKYFTDNINRIQVDLDSRLSVQELQGFHLVQFYRTSFHLQMESLARRTFYQLQMIYQL